MQIDHAIGVAAGVFFAINGVLLVVTVQRGRAICRKFEQRLPEAYEAGERPLPGYFNSPRRSIYFRFIMQEQFAELPDPSLVQDFARQRVLEMRQLVFLVSGFVLFGLAFLYTRFGPAV